MSDLGDLSEKPGRQRLSGFVMRDYEQLVATLALSRETQGVTFAEMARRMGRCYLQQVFNWLNGGSECRARRLFALADALGYDLALIPRDDT
ncbi:MAG: helix-turn-helix transcriptional regulator [Actinoplanes sp.]